MVQAARTIGSPQIRNAGTIGGNLGTCSPAGDTLPVLAALDATILLRSAAGERRVPFAAFMFGPRKSERKPGEIVYAVEWEDAGPSQVFLKAGTRNAMVIAVANLALVVDRHRRAVRVALGSVGPTIIRATAAEELAATLYEESGWDRPLEASEAATARFGELAAAAAQPIDDQRGTARYRRHIVAVMARRALVADGRRGMSRLIRVNLNGEEHEAEAWEGESLLYFLRERLGRFGSKNACEQGECGSCSVLLDGTLVCSCLVLAAAAEGSPVVTVEGLAADPVTAAVQAAMVSAGGVQCGFCTPGFVVSLSDLLRRNPDPDEFELREALSGNLCRCTGYVRIFEAARSAASSLRAAR